jgi:hypothetical protein
LASPGPQGDARVPKVWPDEAGEPEVVPLLPVVVGEEVLPRLLLQAAATRMTAIKTIRAPNVPLLVFNELPPCHRQELLPAPLTISPGSPSV